MKRFEILKQVNSFKKILPAIMVLFTGKERYLPEIIWSNKSWVHNIFRFYELLFWRRYGIRPEISSIYDRRTITYRAHTFEGICALFEQGIRGLKKFTIPIRIHIPILATPFGNMFASPYLFAIVLDTSVGQTGVLTADPWISYTHTCTGSNLLLAVGSSASGVGDIQQATTKYNGIAMSAKPVSLALGNPFIGACILVPPATGSNTLVISQGGTSGSNSACSTSVSFTGVDQTTPIDASGSAGTTAGASITTNFANSLIVDFVGEAGFASLTKGGSQTLINQGNTSGPGPQLCTLSSLPTTSAGSYSTSWTGGGGNTLRTIIHAYKTAGASSMGNFLTFM